MHVIFYIWMDVKFLSMCFIYKYRCIYVGNYSKKKKVNKEEAMNLKTVKEKRMWGFGGRKGKNKIMRF